MPLFQFRNPFRKKENEESNKKTSGNGFSGTTHKQKMVGSSNQELQNWLNQTPNPSSSLQDPLPVVEIS